MSNPTPHSRVLVSLIVVLALVTVASFLQAIAIGLAVGNESFSNAVIAIDLLSRWVIFAIAAYVGAGFARERYGTVAVAGSAFTLLFCIAIMYMDRQPATVYNYASLLVLVSAVGIGASARGHNSIHALSDA